MYKITPGNEYALELECAETANDIDTAYIIFHKMMDDGYIYVQIENPEGKIIYYDTND